MLERHEDRQTASANLVAWALTVILQESERVRLNALQRQSMRHNGTGHGDYQHELRAGRCEGRYGR